MKEQYLDSLEEEPFETKEEAIKEGYEPVAEMSEKRERPKEKQEKVKKVRLQRNDQIRRRCNSGEQRKVPLSPHSPKSDAKSEVRSNRSRSKPRNLSHAFMNDPEYFNSQTPWYKLHHNNFLFNRTKVGTRADFVTLYY